MWWNDVGAVWGWGGCLLLLVAVLAFWGVVIAGVMALFGSTRLTMGPAAGELPRGQTGGSVNTEAVVEVVLSPRQESP